MNCVLDDNFIFFLFAPSLKRMEMYWNEIERTKRNNSKNEQKVEVNEHLLFKKKKKLQLQFFFILLNKNNESTKRTKKSITSHYLLRIYVVLSWPNHFSLLSID